MASDITHEPMDTGTGNSDGENYAWWPVGVLVFTEAAYSQCPRLKEKIWVICIYQGIAEIPVAWALSTVQFDTFLSGYIYINDSEEFDV